MVADLIEFTLEMSARRKDQALRFQIAAVFREPDPFDLLGYSLYKAIKLQ